MRKNQFSESLFKIKVFKSPTQSVTLSNHDAPFPLVRELAGRFHSPNEPKNFFEVFFLNVGLFV